MLVNFDVVIIVIIYEFCGLVLKFFGVVGDNVVDVEFKESFIDLVIEIVDDCYLVNFGC